MQRTALYLRVSTAAQAGEDRFGLAAQQATAERYAQANGLQIVEVYQDTISGTTEERDGLNRLCRESARYDAVLVSAVDRLARDLQVSYATLKLLKTTGLEVHSAEMGVVNDSDEGSVLNFAMRSLVAQMEHMNIKKRLRNGMIAKVRAGTPLVPPNGYGWNQGVIREDEAQWVREIYRWAREGWTTDQIVTELNRLGVPRRVGARWSHSSLKYLLRNALYKGEYSHGKARKGRGTGKHLVTCTVDAIVPPEEWEATQRALASRRKGGRRAVREDIEEFPLAKRLHCGVCGSTLSAGTNYPHPARPKQKVPYRFYHCYRIYKRDGYAGDLCTHRRYYGTKKIHEFILAQVQALLDNNAALERAIQHKPTPTVDIGPALAAIDKKLKNLKDLALHGIIPPEEYRQDRQELEAQRAALLEPAPAVDAPPDVETARQRLRDILTLDNLGAVVRALDLHATIHPDGRVDLTLLAL